jgi:hypothetical protein
VRHNGGVDAAARLHSIIAGRIKLPNTPPPLASNDLFDGPRTTTLTDFIASADVADNAQT